MKKGWLSVDVGLEGEGGFQRFRIPISYLYHKLFKQLLEKARDVYGYHTTGPLKLPCSVDDFFNLKWKIEAESDQIYQYHPYLIPPLGLSFHSQ